MTQNEKGSSKRPQKTKSALSTYMTAYKPGMTKKKSKKKSKKKLPSHHNNVNFFNNKKNSVDSVSNSVNIQYQSPFFSSRDGRPSTIMKNYDPTSMPIDTNSALNMLQYNNMVTVESVKSKKSNKKMIPLKERISKNKRKDPASRNFGKNDSSSLGNRASDSNHKEIAGYSNLKGLNSNNSFGPEAYFAADLLQRNKLGNQFFTEGAPSINESHSKDFTKSRNSKPTSHKSYNKIYSTNPNTKSPGKLTNRKMPQKGYV